MFCFGVFFPKYHSFYFPPPQSRGLYSLNNCTTELILLTKHFRAMVICHLFSCPTTTWQLTGMDNSENTQEVYERLKITSLNAKTLLNVEKKKSI